MLFNNNIFPPHLSSEMYRSHVIPYTDIAPSFHFIHTNADGAVLIGCSQTSGRYWNGSIDIFKSIQETQQHNVWDKHCIQSNTSISDGCFIGNSDKVLYCDDSGLMSVWRRCEGAYTHWLEDISVTEHEDAVVAIDCLESGKFYVTVGADTNIKVWDVDEMICIRNYQRAHCRIITDVAVRPNSTKNIATSSLDYSVCLWDDKVKKPILETEVSNCGVTCLKWLDENSIIIGNEEGVLNSMDIRKPKEVITVARFPAPLHRIIIKEESTHVAVCCDNRIVSIVDVSKGDSTNSRVIYEDRSHSDYVRGLAWDSFEDDILYSVSRDGTINTHKYI